MRPLATLLAVTLVATSLAGCHRSSAAAPPAPAPAAVARPAEPADRNDHDGRAQAAPQADLEVLVNGKPAPPWTLARLAAARKVAVTSSSGEARDGWPLRDVARALVGDKARVVALASDGERVAIDARDWQDGSRTLVLRLSHRGEYKAEWLDAGGSGDGAFLKHIRRVELAN